MTENSASPATPVAPDPADPVGSADAGERLSIDQLATLTGLTARTVRYYIQQDLVSRPEGAKRGAYYGRRHVEQLLLIRRWTDAGLSLDRVRELIAGSPEDPPRRAAPPGSVEVWSRVTVADGLEVHLEPGRAGLTPEQVRAFIRGLAALYRQTRSEPNTRTPRDPA
jgi:DNA-binding transcriptional MerR regulator